MRRPIRRLHTRRHGFSLVLSLTVMAMLVLLCLNIAALMTLEMRVARATLPQTRARLNALVAARIALGELQRLAGPDRRVTATSGILDTNIASPDRTEGVEQPRITGVWRGQCVTSAYDTTHNKAFLGWLVSGTGSGTSQQALLDYPKTRLLNGVLLLSAPPAPPAEAAGLQDKDATEVYAAPDPIPDRAGMPTGGSIAWWISDENQKANLALRLPSAASTTPLQSAQNAPRYALKLADDGALANFPDTLPFNAGLMSRESLVFDKPAADTTAAWWTDSRNYFHHLTPYSETLLTDVVNGGLKYDLSLLFAMDRLPPGYFGDTAFVGMKAADGEQAVAKSRWISENPALNAVLEPRNDPANPNPKPVNATEWTCWGDVWNYARLYRHPAFDPVKGMLINSAADAHGNADNTTLDPQRNVTDVQNLSPWREPVISQVQMVLGFRVKPNGAKYDLYMVMRPYLQLWNPYNVPLRFTGNEADSLLARVVAIPGRVEITCADSSGGGGTLNTNNWNVFLSQSGYFNIFQAYVNFADVTRHTPMAPGEVRNLSPVSKDLVSETKLDLGPGLRPFGGFETKVTNENGAIKPFDGTMTVTVHPSDGPGSYGMNVWNDWGRTRWEGIYQKDSPGRGWSVGYAATDDNTSKQLMDFDSTPVTSPISQMEGQGRFCALITMRLRSETISNLAFPALAYGDPLRWSYMPPARSNFKAGQDIRMLPYEFIHSRITSDNDLIPDNPVMSPNLDTNSPLGYAFTGYTAGTGVSHLIFSHLPLAPLGGLGELRHARLGGGAAYARRYQPASQEQSRFTAVADNSALLTGASVVPDAFGNSFSHPMVPRDKITADSATFPKESFYDFSWIMNAALADAYCMTGLTPQDSKIAALTPGGATRTLGAVATDFFIKGKPLPNAHLLLRDYGVGGPAMQRELTEGDKPTETGYAKSAAMMAVNGGFNVNSTSVRAWRALLSGLNGAEIPLVDCGATTIVADKIRVGETDHVMLRAPIQSGSPADVNTGGISKTFNERRATGGRKLSEAQLTLVAQKIVEQVKLRGPFLSLGEFLNRRLESTTKDKPPVVGEKGAVQAALDDSGVNEFATTAPVRRIGTVDLDKITPALPNPDAVLGSQGRALPGYLVQADLLGPLFTRLTPRSDTFTIRARGATEEGADAYVELIVRRSSVFLDQADNPFTSPDLKNGDFRAANKAFGRRFVIVGLRWLTKDQI